MSFLFSFRYLCLFSIFFSFSVIFFFLSAEYIWGLEPCELCYWDRLVWYIMFPLSILGFLGFIRDFILWLLGLFNVLQGLVVTMYHYGVELLWWGGLDGCSSTLPDRLGEQELSDFLLSREVVVSCADVVWEFWGISMAGYGVITLIFLFLYYIFVGYMDFIRIRFS